MRKVNITNILTKRLRRKSKKETTKTPLILLHKIGISGMSREIASRNIEKYQKSIDIEINEVGDMKFKNIVVGDIGGTTVDILVVYPNIDDIMNKLDGHLTISQERKLKIFKLLYDKK